DAAQYSLWRCRRKLPLVPRRIAQRCPRGAAGGNCSEWREYTNEELKVLIQSLVDHAQRHGDGNALPRYYRSRTVRWVIKIDQQRKATLIDSADADNKSGLTQPCPILTRTSGIAPMLLVDPLEYRS